MFATCIFCFRKFGRNTSVRSFPVGRCLAFDELRGRLWVVCEHCGQWNLSPIEERWTAIEECESLFRRSGRRIATSNASLTRIARDLRLVRLGKSPRPEMLAWRYGNRLVARRRRRIAIAVLVGGILTFGAVMGVTGLAYMWGALAAVLGGVSLFPFLLYLLRGSPDDLMTKVVCWHGEVIEIFRFHLGFVMLARDEDSGEPVAVVPGCEDCGMTILAGDAALGLCAVLLPRMSRFGASATQISAALELLDSTGTPMELLAHCSQTPVSVPSLPKTTRLALEIASHEDFERRVAEGELEKLAEDWKAAEEIASIADNLLVPPPVEGMLHYLRSTLRPDDPSSSQSGRTAAT